MFYTQEVAGKWRWILYIAGVDIAISGVAYETKADCLRAVRLVQMSSVYPVS